MITTGEGIVLKELPKSSADDILDTELQLIVVFWAPRDVDLYAEARRIAQAWVEDPGYKPPGMVMKNTELEIVRAETSWLDAPTIKEMQMRRFSDVAEEIS